MNEDEEIDLINMSIRNEINEKVIPAWEETGIPLGMEDDDGNFMISASLLSNIITSLYDNMQVEDEEPSDFDAGAIWIFNVIISTIRATADYVRPMYVPDITGEYDEDE